MKYLRTYESNINIINNRKLKKREIESIIWDADDQSKIELFWKWVEDNARKILLKCSDSEVTDYMTTDEMERFLEYYKIVLDSNKYNL